MNWHDINSWFLRENKWVIGLHILAKGLNSCLPIMNESFCLLKAPGSSTDHWDSIIAYMWTLTRESLEVLQGASVNYLKELENFIEGRAQPLENIQGRESKWTESKTSITIIFKATCIGKFKPKVNVFPLRNKDYYLFKCKNFYRKTLLCRNKILTPMMDNTYCWWS